MENVTKKYTNGEVTIIWKPKMCIHSGLCFHGTPSVFNPHERPWIKPEGATTEKIIEQVKRCPSGALSYYLNRDMDDSTIETTAETKIEASPNGPMIVYGNVLVKDAKGNEMRKNNVTAFCRCGQSNNKPFCDGAHVTSGFKD